MIYIFDCIATTIVIFVVSLAYLLLIPFAILFCIIGGIYSDIKRRSWDEVRFNFRVLCEGINEGLKTVKEGIIKIWKS